MATKLHKWTQAAGYELLSNMAVAQKDVMQPKWVLGKWKQRPNPAQPWFLTFEPHPHFLAGFASHGYKKQVGQTDPGQSTVSCAVSIEIKALCTKRIYIYIYTWALRVCKISAVWRKSNNFRGFFQKALFDPTTALFQDCREACQKKRVLAE